MRINTSALRREHAELTRRSMRLRRIVSLDRAPPMAELSLLRRDFSDLLIVHLTVEDREVYPALMATGEIAVARIARDFAEEMGGIAAAYRDYSHKWTDARVAEDWRGFADATIDILDALAQRIVRENRILYPMLDQPAVRAVA